MITASIMKGLRDFIVIDSPLKLASRQQPMRFYQDNNQWDSIKTTTNEIRPSHIAFSYCYCMLCEAQVSSYPYWKECVLFYLHQNELIAYYQQTNYIYSQILYSNIFDFRNVLKCWQKILVSSAYRYIWVFEKVCGISFMYSKNSIGLNIDPWVTLQYMVPASEKPVPNETKVALFVRSERNHFTVLPEKLVHFIFSNKTLWSKVSKTI